MNGLNFRIFPALLQESQSRTDCGRCHDTDSRLPSVVTAPPRMRSSTFGGKADVAFGFVEQTLPVVSVSCLIRRFIRLSDHLQVVSGRKLGNAALVKNI
jgi:hypothetical protein